MSDVNCNGCTACCKRDKIVLGINDDRSFYRHHKEWVNYKEYDVLDRKPNGDCTYLTDSGCSIHGEAPGICQRMDCRELYLNTSPETIEKRVRQNKQMIHIYLAGAQRIHKR